jgi:arginyl-tRNA synthetase
MIQAKQELLQAQTALAEAQLPPGPAPVAAFESPKQAAHGDLAITAAMQLARSLKKNPRELAQALVAALQAQPAVQRWVQALEIAGPGFINLRLKPPPSRPWWPRCWARRRFGRSPPAGAR